MASDFEIWCCIVSVGLVCVKGRKANGLRGRVLGIQAPEDFRRQGRIAIAAAAAAVAASAAIASACGEGAISHTSDIARTYSWP